MVNVAFDQITQTERIIPTITLGRVLKGAVPFKNNNVSDTYRGPIITEGNQTIAVIKDISAIELANELLSAAIGIKLGLPIPKPILALASKENLTAKNGPMINGERLVFCSEDVKQPSLAFHYRGANGGYIFEQIIQKISEWDHIGNLYAFDAFIANTDRNLGNILISDNFEFWIIDHAYCFTGPNWKPEDLVPADQQVLCKLSHWLTPKMSERYRTDSASKAASLEHQVRTIDFKFMALATYLQLLLSAGQIDGVLTFLTDRTPHIPRLAGTNLGVGVLL
jgi:hypothetical protein